MNDAKYIKAGLDSIKVLSDEVIGMQPMGLSLEGWKKLSLEIEKASSKIKKLPDGCFNGIIIKGENNHIISSTPKGKEFYNKLLEDLKMSRVNCEDCRHYEYDEICSGCSNYDYGDGVVGCSCHLNPPCSYCVDLKYEDKYD